MIGEGGVPVGECNCDSCASYIIRASDRAPHERSVPASLKRPRLFHINRDMHPRMNAALKVMFTLLQSGDFDLTTLEDSRSGYGDTRKTGRAFRHWRLSSIESSDEAPAEVVDLSKSVRFSALVYHAKDRSFVDMNSIGFKIPLFVWSSAG